MPSLIVWKERELAKMRREMEQLCDRLWSDFTYPTMSLSLQPEFKIFEQNDSLVVQTRLTGFGPEDIRMTVSDDELQIKGCRQRQVAAEYNAIHQSGGFSSTLKLPCRVDPDGARATFRDDILQVILPKWSGRRARNIRIQTP